MPDIRLLTLADRSLVYRYLRQHPPEISEHTFTNLYVWSQARPIYLTEAEDTLFILCRSQVRAGYTLFGPPAGNLTLPEFVNLLNELDVQEAVRLPAPLAFLLRDAGYAIEPDRNNADYVYQVRELAELTGRRFAKKRNHLKRCLQLHQCVYEPIGPANIDECRTMQESWCEIRGCVDDLGLGNEYTAICEMFDHVGDFGLLGGAIRVDGKIMAYAIAEELAPGIAVCHFEKAMAEVPGLSQLVNAWFAQNALAGFELVNREQDLGIPGLRQAKESYYPDHMVDKYSVRF